MGRFSEKVIEVCISYYNRFFVVTFLKMFLTFGELSYAAYKNNWFSTFLHFRVALNTHTTDWFILLLLCVMRIHHGMDEHWAMFSTVQKCEKSRSCWYPLEYPQIFIFFAPRPGLTIFSIQPTILQDIISQTTWNELDEHQKESLMNFLPKHSCKEECNDTLL